MSCSCRNRSRGLAGHVAEKGDYDSTIVEAMARAAFVSAWASKQEDKAARTRKRLNWGGADLMDLAPTTNAAAKRWAKQLAADLVRQNKVRTVTDLVSKAARADGRGEAVGFEYARKFGHYVAMMALGHGVGWWDDHEKFQMTVPYSEFYY
jgi:hypothetical protein